MRTVPSFRPALKSRVLNARLSARAAPAVSVARMPLAVLVSGPSPPTSALPRFRFRIVSRDEPTCADSVERLPIV